jgi:hypothetical protein
MQKLICALFVFWSFSAMANSTPGDFHLSYDWKLAKCVQTKTSITCDGAVMTPGKDLTVNLADCDADSCSGQWQVTQERDGIKYVFNISVTRLDFRDGSYFMLNVTLGPEFDGTNGTEITNFGLSTPNDHVTDAITFSSNPSHIWQDPSDGSATSYYGVGAIAPPNPAPTLN